MGVIQEVGVDHLTLLDVSPPDLVSVAHGAGFDCVSIRVRAVSPDEHPWPMDAGSPMLAETLRRLDDTGLRALGVEVVRLTPETTRSDYEAALESGAELGARYVTVNGVDPDLERTKEIFAALTADARPYGLRPLMEPVPYTEVSNLDDAVSIAEYSGGGGILLDSLHFYRYGGSLEQLRSLDPDLLSYAQLCDASLIPPEDPSGTGLQQESRAMRLMPGEGELPLTRFLTALPADLPVSAEVPNLDMRKALSPIQYASRARQAVTEVLETSLTDRKAES
jgi:sugar phosphate isomerase/epimerase